jgi:hypothetical protein
MKKLTLLLLISIFCEYSSFSCTCHWSGNFLETYNKTKTGLVVVGKVLGYNYYKDGNKIELATNDKSEYDRVSLLVEIERVVNGEEKRQRIEILASNGMDCLTPWHYHKPDNYYVFYLFPIEELTFLEHKINPDTGNGMYGLYICAETSMKYIPETKEVEGMIWGLERGKMIRMKFDDLLVEMNK